MLNDFRVSANQCDIKWVTCHHLELNVAPQLFDQTMKMTF